MKNQSKIFRRNKLKDVLFFLVCLVFIVAGYSLLEKNPWMGWLGISFFGLGAVLFFIQLLTDSSYLKIDKEGFEEKSLFRTKKYKWSDVRNFRQVNFRMNKSIFFDYTDEYKKWNSKNKLSIFQSKKQGAVTSSYNIKTEDLLDLLNAYKRKSK